MSITDGQTEGTEQNDLENKRKTRGKRLLGARRGLYLRRGRAQEWKINIFKNSDTRSVCTALPYSFRIKRNIVKWVTKFFSVASLLTHNRIQAECEEKERKRRSVNDERVNRGLPNPTNRKMKEKTRAEEKRRSSASSLEVTGRGL